MRIMDDDDIMAVRATALSMLPADRALAWLPDTTIVSPGVATKAEMVVITRIGADWTLIEAGAAPAGYAGGDSVSARDLLHGACVLFAASFLCPVLKQIVPVQEKSELILRVIDLDWDDLQGTFLRQGQELLGLLSPDVTANAFSLARRTPARTDPASTNPFVRTGFAPLFPSDIP